MARTAAALRSLPGGGRNAIGAYFVVLALLMPAVGGVDASRHALVGSGSAERRLAVSVPVLDGGPEPGETPAYLPVAMAGGRWGPHILATPEALATSSPGPSATGSAVPTDGASPTSHPRPSATELQPASPTPSPWPTSPETATTVATTVPSLTPAPHPVDECADPEPEWVFCDGFESGRRWDGSVEIPTVVAEPGPFSLEPNHVARLRVPPGSGGHGLWKKLPESDRLYARWYVQWEPGHDISARHHGPGGLGADTAWYTGRSGIRPKGDEYFVSTLEPTTKSPHVMYAYTYYRGMYMDCADPNGRCWGDLFPCYAGPRYCKRPEHLPKVEQDGVETGRWYCLEQMIDAGRPTTNGSQADGRLDFWIDEVEIGPWTDLWWRITPELKINFLWLFLYHHGDHSEEGIMIDNVVVSTSRIGCGR